MRPLPLLLVLLVALFGVALALKVMWGSQPGDGGAPGTPASMPRYLGGKPQGHVYTGQAGEPADINPFTTYDAVARSQVLAYTHDTLLERDIDTGELIGALAESWQVAPDGRSCTFTLRDGVVFSDGSPLTMADVLFGLELAQAGHLPLGFVGTAFRRVASAEALDARRLRVQLDGRHFAAVAVLGTGWVVASRRFFVEQVRRRLASGEELPDVASPRFAELLDQVDEQCGPGTGPYQLIHEPGGESHWRRRQDLLLTRHEACWRRSVRPGRWNFAAMRLLFRDQVGARNALLRGELDWYADPQLDQLLAAHPALGERYRKLLFDVPRLGCYRIVWNCRRPPFDDVRVRRALAMLIDRSELLEVFAGAARPAVAHAKPGTPEYPDVAPLPFDPKAARVLLREAGFDPAAGRPLRLRLLALQGNEPLRRIVELFAGAARKVGIDLDVRPRDMAAFVAEKKEGDWDGLLALQFFETWNDPYRFLHRDGTENEGGWRNAEADRLAEAARVELDADERARLWRQLHELAHREQPVALLVHPLAAVLFNRHIEDCEPGPLGLSPHRAWVPPDYQRQ